MLAPSSDLRAKWPLFVSFWLIVTNDVLDVETQLQRRENHQTVTTLRGISFLKPPVPVPLEISKPWTEKIFADRFPEFPCNALNNKESQEKSTSFVSGVSRSQVKVSRS